MYFELDLGEYLDGASREDPKGYTPFVVAVDWNNDEVVRHFLENRRDLLERSLEQVVKALHIAAGPRPTASGLGFCA